MRVSYSPPSVNQFDIIFRPTNVSYSGGGLNDIKVFKPYYRGGSLFGILGSIVRRSIPFLKNFIFPEAGNFARNMANDMHGNIPLRTNIKKNLIRSAKNIGKNILHGGRRMKRTLSGKSKKDRKRNKNNKLSQKDYKKKRCNSKAKDIFSSNGLNF